MILKLLQIFFYAHLFSLLISDNACKKCIPQARQIFLSLLAKLPIEKWTVLVKSVKTYL